MRLAQTLSSSQPCFPAAGSFGPSPHLSSLVGASAAIVAVRNRIDRLADGGAPVLIAGPPGSGKTVVAELLHQRGGRATQPFVVINNGRRAEGKLEAILFGAGDAAGTLGTGALKRAGRGTLFLDDLGAMPPSVQARLLDVLAPPRSWRRRRVPAPAVRIVAATGSDLRAAVAAGSFRADLYALLATHELTLPALADRQGDIALLIDHFVARTATPGSYPRFTAAARAYLARQPWPDNVRTLGNFVARAIARYPGQLVDESAAAILLHGERRAVDRWLASAVDPVPMPNRRRPPPIVAAAPALGEGQVLTAAERGLIDATLGYRRVDVAALGLPAGAPPACAWQRGDGGAEQV